MHMVGGGSITCGPTPPSLELSTGCSLERTVRPLDSIGDRGARPSGDVGSQVAAEPDGRAGGCAVVRGPHKVGNRPTSAPEDVWVLLHGERSPV